MFLVSLQALSSRIIARYYGNMVILYHLYVLLILKVLIKSVILLINIIK